MLTQHIRHAARTLRKSPGFVVVAVLLLGLALAVGTTTYAALDALIHPYTPIKDAGQVFDVVMGGDGRSGTVSGWDMYQRLRNETRSFESISFALGEFGEVQAGTHVEQFVRGARVPPGFFELLGVKPIAGRLFSSQPNAIEDDAAVISAAVWQRFFARGPLERAEFSMNGRAYRVIGVVPEGIGGDVWTPLPTTAELRNGITPFVRLRRGVTREQAAQELDSLAARLTEEYGAGLRGFIYRLWSMQPDALKLSPVHVALGAAALLVLLIACSNLASLMLARGITRRRELAVRLALGASRRALVSQLVVESAFLAVLGGLIGVLLATWSIHLLQSQLPPQIGDFLDLNTPHLSWRIFAFALGATGATVLLFGLMPALRVSSVAVSEPLKDNSGGTTGRTHRDFHLLVITEVALALVLLMGGMLLLRAAGRMNDFAFGYDPHGLLTAGVFFGKDTPEERLDRAYDEMVDRAMKVNGAVSAATYAEAAGGVVMSDVAGGPLGAGRVYRRTYPVVSPNFLETLGIPIVEGRDFAEGDREAGNVAIVDQTAAHLLWPNGSGIGRQIKIGLFDSDTPWLTLIGVAKDARLRFQNDPDLIPEPAIYQVQGPAAPRSWHVVVRVKGDEGAAAVQLRNSMADALTQRWIFVRPWRQEFDQLVAAHDFIAAVFVLFGMFALGLAAVGLYGVLAYATSQRMREFGVRVALGARSPDLMRLVFRDAAVMVLAGTGVGAFMAMAGGQVLGTWLYTVPPTDAVSLVTAELILVTASLLAGLGPALRAMRADPMEILRAT